MRGLDGGCSAGSFRARGIGLRIHPDQGDAHGMTAQRAPDSHNQDAGLFPDKLYPFGSQRLGTVAASSPLKIFPYRLKASPMDVPTLETISMRRNHNEPPI